MDKNEITKEYNNGELTIVWKPSLCIHAALCVQALPEVYRPKESPWIAIENATSRAIVEQIKTCPSGALSYRLDSQTLGTHNKTKTMENSKVAGKSPVIVDLESGKAYAWCACGHSSKQPWCDGSHAGSGITPVVFKAGENKKAAMCMCKKSGNSPYCDGSHGSL